MNGPTLTATPTIPSSKISCRTTRISRRTLPLLLALPLALPLTIAGCANLSYEDDSRTAVVAAPVLLEVGFGVPEESTPPAASNPSGNDDDLALGDASNGERAKAWYELTREARVARKAGDFETAREALAQAAAQLDSRPPDNAQRRAVHGSQARLALLLIGAGQTEEAEELAEEVFAEAESDPLIGGPATVELATYFARSRANAAAEAGLPESQLPLLRVALLVAEREPASRSRLALAYDISQIATREGDHDLARRGIDRAVLDSKTLDPLDRSQLASLKIFKTRIALAQGDLATAEATGAAANRLFEEIDAPTENRAIGEATIARIIAERGDAERARAIAMSARARLGGDPPPTDYGTRIVLGELARLERAAGDLDAARDLYTEALDLPGADMKQDIDLVAELTQELAALNEGEARVTTSAEPAALPAADNPSNRPSEPAP